MVLSVIVRQSPDNGGVARNGQGILPGDLMDRAEIVHENFLARVARGDLPAGRAPDDALNRQEAVALFRAQVLSRALDLASRTMQKAGQGYYTIGSSGHEGMAQWRMYCALRHRPASLP